MKLLKKLSALLLVALIGFTTAIISSENVKAAGGNLYIHYFRYDNTFTNWHLWVWPEGGSGTWVEFDSTDEYGAVATLSLDSYGKKAGVIVVKGEWGEKDPDGDRYIDLTNLDASGNVHAYLVTGSEEIYYDRASVDTSHKILTSYFESETRIKFTTTAQDAGLISSIKLFEDDTVIANSYTSYSNGVGYINLSSDIDLSKSYSLKMTIDGVETELTVGYDGIYNSAAFNNQFYYDGDDLGVTYSSNSSVFKLWAPLSSKVELCLYEKGHTTSVRSDGVDDPYKTVLLEKGEKGVWSATVNGDLDSIYYTYKVTNGKKTTEVVDPYAESTGVNGARGMIVNYNSEKTTPTGWDPTKKPAFSGNYVDAIIYEMHVRDITTHSTWQGTEKYRGTFMGVAESGTTYTKNGVTVKTGLDHIAELGVTHVQILPIEEFPFVDETRLDDEAYKNQAVDGLFNWGYMTDNYNAIEGSYSTDPYDGNVRVKEYRTMIQAFHDNGIRVNMDVVYNHSARSSDSNFNIIIPGYFHRMVNGSFSNGSGCGNETASDRLMVRKFMVDSLKHWTEDYGIDGYRFDLMSLHDYTTMNTIYDTLAEIEPGIMIYGEPWTGGTSALAGSEMATKSTMNKMPNVGSFCDYSRDGYKGTAKDFEASKVGFLYDPTNKAGAKYGISGGTVGSSEYSYVSPNQQINYVECHDNWTLFDKVAYYYLSGNDVSSFPKSISTYDINTTIAPKVISGGALLLTSQGISFLDSGIEMLRTKGGDGNSYNKSDAVNQLDYSRKVTYNYVFTNYQELISIRKNHPSLRMTSYDEINKNLTFLDTNSSKFIAYKITSTTDEWGEYIVIHNTDKYYHGFTVDLGTYTPVYTSVSTSTNTVGVPQTTDYIDLEANETVILVKKFNQITPPGPGTTDNNSSSSTDNNSSSSTNNDSSSSSTNGSDSTSDGNNDTKKNNGANAAIIAVSVIGGVAVVGGATALVIVKVKPRKKNNVV